MATDAQIMQRAAIAFEGLVDQQRRVNQIQSALTGTPMRAVTQQQEQAFAAQAASNALKELEENTVKTNRGLKGFGGSLDNLLLSTGLKTYGLAHAVSPALANTLASSFEMLAGEIGMHVVPSLLDLSYGLQRAARFVRGLDERASRGINQAGGQALAATGGMMAARTLGFGMGGPVGMAMAFSGLALQASGGAGGEGFKALEAPINELVRLLGSLLEAARPFLTTAGHLLETELRTVAMVLSSINSLVEVIARNMPGGTSSTSTPAAGYNLGPIGGQMTWQRALLGLGTVGISEIWGLAYRSFIASGASAGGGGLPGAGQPPAVSTGFQSRQISIESMHDVLQQEMVRDQVEQQRFERHMQFLAEQSRWLQAIHNTLGGTPGGDGYFANIWRVILNSPVPPSL